MTTIVPGVSGDVGGAPPNPADPFAGYPMSLRAGYMLRRSHRLHSQLWATRVEQPLTPPQYGVLSAIQRNPGIDQRTLGECVSLDRASVSDLVGRLSRRGDIMRSRDPKDSRRNVLTLAPATDRRIRRLRGRTEDVWRDLFAPVPAVRRESFVAQLETMADFVPPERDAGSLFRRLEQRRASTWNTVVGDVLTGPQYAVLHVIGRWPGLIQGELGELAALDKATAASLLDRLARAGWVERHADPRDARLRRLSPTPAGAALLSALAPSLRRVDAVLLAPIPRDEIREMLENWAQLAYRGHIPASAR